MTLDDLTVNFDNLDRSLLLSDWRWLIGDKRLPILITIAGDAFVHDATDGTVHFLDTLNGSLSKVADNADDFSSLLEDKHFVVEHFSFNTVAPFIRAGNTPGPGRVFSYDVPPALGGSRSPSNFSPTDISIHFSLLGQIFEQVRDLPPGTPITSIKWLPAS